MADISAVTAPACTRLESFRFEGEEDYESEFFPILSSARARTNVILAGKFGSRRQSTTNFSEHVVVAKKSYQMLEILSLSDRERALSLSMEISVSTFVVKKKYNEECRVSVFRKNREENLTLNVVVVVVLVHVIESKVL